MGSRGAQCGVKGEIADTILTGEPSLYIVTTLAVSFGLGTAARLAASQAIELGIQAARGKFLPAFYVFAPFPPLPILRSLGDGLRPGFGLGCFGAFPFFFRL